jgi:hypothetical protein
MVVCNTQGVVWIGSLGKLTYSTLTSYWITDSPRNSRSPAILKNDSVRCKRQLIWGLEIMDGDKSWKACLKVLFLAFGKMARVKCATGARRVMYACVWIIYTHYMWRNVHLSAVSTYWLQYFEFVINKYKANGICTFVKIKQGTIYTEAGHSSWWCNHRYTSPACWPTSWIYCRFWTVIYTVWIPQCINSRRANWTSWLDCGIIQLPHTVYSRI